MKNYYVLDETCTGHRKRIFQLVMRSFSIDANTRGTWCSLFKTKGYKRAVETRRKINKHLQGVVKKEFPEVKSWKIANLLGSAGMHDVRVRRRQKYLLEVDDGKC